MMLLCVDVVCGLPLLVAVCHVTFCLRLLVLIAECSLLLLIVDWLFSLIYRFACFLLYVVIVFVVVGCDRVLCAVWWFVVCCLWVVCVFVYVFVFFYALFFVTIGCW